MLSNKLTIPILISLILLSCNLQLLLCDWNKITYNVHILIPDTHHCIQNNGQSLCDSDGLYIELDMDWNSFLRRQMEKDTLKIYVAKVCSSDDGIYKSFYINHETWFNRIGQNKTSGETLLLSILRYLCKIFGRLKKNKYTYLWKNFNWNW